MDKYLTTKELAELLRLKERKVYDMAAAGEVPCTRATGKLLFPREAVDAWLAEHTETNGIAALRQRPNVVLGSHDPLLEWALRECRSNLATFFDSSRDGLERFNEFEGIATGMHVYDAASEDWNTPLVSRTASAFPVVLIEWAWRKRGLIVANGNPLKIKSVANLKSRTVVPRQATAGSQLLLESVLEKEGLAKGDVTFASPALSEADAALAVQTGRADAAFGLASLAAQHRLDFVPVMDERFDLLIDRRSYFEPPIQKLFAFAQTESFRGKAADLGGYDIADLGQVRYNAPR